MQRQRVTAERALSALGRNPGELGNDPRLNEYDHRGLLLAYLPVIAQEHPEFRQPPQALLGDLQAFQTCFNLAIEAWMNDRPAAAPLAESWEAFNARCVDGLMAAASLGKQVVAFTSGGVITAALREALKLDRVVLQRLNLRIFNASVHIFNVGRSGLSLIGYNDIAHLRVMKDEALLTHR
jgi:broad specificity phosphatase PhoE